jgi:hypothetical protein
VNNQSIRITDKTTEVSVGDSNSFGSIVQALTSQSFTANNNVVVALDIATLNQFLWTQFADGYSNGGNAVVSNIAVIVPGETTQLVSVNLQLGPPVMAFGSGNNEVTLTSMVVSGSLAFFDLVNLDVSYQIDLSSALADVTGTFSLDVAAGTDVGTVTINFGTSLGWTMQLDGITSGSVTAVNIDTALQDYFSGVDFSYNFGTVSTGQNVPSYLTPTSFTLQSVPNQNDMSDYLLMLITTEKGTPGSQMTTTQQLIPDDTSTMAVLVQSSIVADAIATQMNSNLGGFGCAFSAAMNTNGTWSITTPGGTLSTPGQVEGYDTTQTYMVDSANGPGNYGPVNIPLGTGGGNAGVTFTPGVTPSLQLASSWTQGWEWILVSYLSLPKYVPIGMTAAFSADFTTSVLGSANITFSSPPSITPSFTPNPLVYDTYNMDGGQVISQALTSSMTSFAQNLTLPNFNEFLITSLLFPGGGIVQLTEAALPCDLYAAGTIAQTYSLTPAITAAGPGQTVDYTLKGSPSGSVTYSLLPPTYPSPSWNGSTLTVPNIHLAAPKNWTVAATCGETSELIAASVLTITPQPFTYRIVPFGCSVPVNGQVVFEVVDVNGNPQTGTVTASAGTVQRQGLTSTYAFTAPSTPGSVTITATIGSVVATATWTIAAVADLTMTPASPNLTSDQSVTFTLSGIPANATPQWTLANANGGAAVGTLTPSGDGSSAVYTVGTVQNDETMYVIAYLLAMAGGNFGMAGTAVNITP